MKTPIFDMTHHRLQFICTVDSRFKGLGFLLLATEVVEWTITACILDFIETRVVREKVTSEYK